MADENEGDDVNMAEEESSHSELEDDDYDLLEENLGVKVQRKKFKRLRRISDDSDDEITPGTGDDRDAIAQQLFEGSDNEEDKEDDEDVRNRDHYSSDSDEYSETDDFIVDDEGLPIKESRRQRKRRFPVSDAIVQEAQDIFGLGFDYSEFERFGDQDRDDDDEDQSEDEEEDRRQPSKKKSRKVKALHEIYEPLELERAGYTQLDVKIQKTDIPERLQTRLVPVEEARDDELEEEAEWICRKAKFTGVGMQAYASLPGPAQSEANWGQDWDSRTGVAAPNANTIPIPAPPATNAAWAELDNWENESTVPTPSSVPIPAPAASVAADDSVWEDWDKGTTVGVGTRDFVDWKRPAPPPPRIAEKPNPSDTPSATAVADDRWAEEAWETRTTIGQTPAPPRSVAESNPIIVPAPAPEDSPNSDLTSKVRETLKFIRNHHFEVPFIAFYRKEFVLPELSVSDLWKIYRLDAEFCELKKRKAGLLKLYQNMKDYLLEKCTRIANEEEEFEHVRMITDDHLERVQAIKSVDELKDAGSYFNLHYKKHVPEMHNFLHPEPEENPDTQGNEERKSVYKLKRKTFTCAYDKMFSIEKIHPFLDKLGTTSEKFAENVRDKYQRHEVEQWPVGPYDLAKEIVAGETLAAKHSEVLTSAQYVLSVQIAHEPYVRQAVRKEFFEKATISCWPTKQGQRDIDEAHPCFTIKYLKDKPVKTFVEDQFLKLVMAEKDKLINISIGEEFDNFEEIKQLITRDEFSQPVREWNDVREVCLKLALKDHLLPVLRKELREKLLEDCNEYILEHCRSKLYQLLGVAPIKVNYPDEEEIEWDTNQGVRVMSIAYDPEFDHAGAMVAVLRPDGEPDIRSYKHGDGRTDRLKLTNFLRRNGEEKDEDLHLLKDYIREMKPHVIVIAGESREALRLKTDVTEIVGQLVNEDAFPEIRVEIVDNEAAKVYAGSNKAFNDLGSDYPTLQRQAISLGRRIQDPLLELSQLWTMDDDILCLKFHPLQDQVPKERLKERLEIEFIDRTCEVGVDINRALSFPHTANVVQFVAGLGRRKAFALLHKLRQKPGRRLENRSQLLTLSILGPKVFLNCAGFIKIDTSAMEESSETYLEILDGTRVHPESYEFARRMAVDALYNEDDGEVVAREATAVEELMEDPDPSKLNALDLDECAKLLTSQGQVGKLATLIDIREELKDRYRDLRQDFKSPDEFELLRMLTKETPETLYVGKLIMATVGNVVRRKLKEEEVVEPIQNKDTWQCPQCGKKYGVLEDLWKHFDDGTCPGPAMGVQLYLENGFSGFIPTQKLSDKPVINPEERVYPGQKIYCRVTKVQCERFSVECTSRSSDLVDSKDEWKRKRDEYYDKEREDFDLQKRKEEEQRKQQQTQRQVYIKRVIVHPSFRNVTYKEAEKMMETMEQGDVIVRPSSKGSNHLTFTWKVSDGVFQHIDVREEGKSTAFSLGQSLWIENEEFEDIDEIIARHITPMALNAKDIMNYRYYVADLGGCREKAEEYLKQQKQKNGNKIHYIFQASKKYPGKFLLSYMPKNAAAHEFVTVTHDGFRYRGQIFENLNELLKWFKIHYKDPPPTSTPITMSTGNTYAAQRNYGFPGYQTAAGSTRTAPRLGFGIPPVPASSVFPPRTTPHYATPLQGFTPYTPYAGATNQVNGSKTPAVTPRVVPTPPTRGSQEPARDFDEEEESWE